MGAELEQVRITIDLGEDGVIVRWLATDPCGKVLEEFRLVGTDPTGTVHSYAWDMPGAAAYLVARDILRFLTQADWQPNTVL